MGSVKVDQIKAREHRMANPWQPRFGTISAGHTVRYCKGCKKPIPVKKLKKDQNNCPTCGGALGKAVPQALNYFRFRDFPSDITKLIVDTLGSKPTVVPFTFPMHPTECIFVGRQCYQGSHLHCQNEWKWHPEKMKWVNGGRAVRRKSGGGSQRVEIDCVPSACPYCIGGQDPASGKPIRPGQCGESVSAMILLPDFPGLELVRYHSGGINTINNFQDAVKKLLGLLHGRWRALRLELRIRAKAVKYPDADGNLRPTTIWEIYIHFPHSINELIEKAKRGELTDGDLFVELPALSPDRAMIEEKHQQFDELIDGARTLPEPERRARPEPEPINLADAAGQSELLPEQAEPLITEEQQANMKRLIADLATTEAGRRALVQDARKSCNVPKGTRMNKITASKADAVLKYLQRRVDAMVPEGKLDLTEEKDWGMGK